MQQIAHIMKNISYLINQYFQRGYWYAITPDIPGTFLLIMDPEQFSES
ncbi:MAG: hypothetical protein AB1611_03615 [bacterium]